MNGCNEEFSESKIIERNDRVKKVYRYVTDVARRLGEATVGSRIVADLFTTAIETQRQKLRDNCEKLFFLDPENYGKKSLELLWRKVYYDTISAAKKLRETDNTYDNDLFTLIICGIGQFHNMITRIQSEMNIELKELDFLSTYIDEEMDDCVKKNLTEEENQLGKTIIYSCLIYLGDLSRYQVEIFNVFEPSIAARYYLQASQIDCQVRYPSGMPFNQLGNLYLGKNFNLDSVCYYIHCLSFVSPFDGAIGNLTKIFEKNAQFCDLLKDSESLTQSEHMQVTIANFLSLIEIWYFDKPDGNIPKICSAIAHQLKLAMNFTKTPLPDKNKNYNEYTQALEEESVNPSYMNSSVIHCIVKICLFTISKLNENNESKAFACKAFTLALLSQLLQKLLKQVETIGLKNPAYKFSSKFLSKPVNNHNEDNTKEDSPLEDNVITTNGKKEEYESSDKENVSEEDNKVRLNGDTKNNKKIPIKRRRRRRIDSSESSDMSDIDANRDIKSDTSGSDEDNLSDSTYRSDDNSNTDGSLSDDFDEDEFHAPTKCNSEEVTINANIDENNTTKKKTSEIKSNEINNDYNKVNPEALHDFLMGDNFLPSIKLLQDWALTEKDLILSCGESGETLFQCVVDLLNTFKHYFNPQTELHSEEKLVQYARHIAKKYSLEYKSIPLTEDINLRGTNICKFDKDAAEWQTLGKIKPIVIGENVIRILHFIDFGYNISKIIPRIRYNKFMKIYYFKKVLPPKVNTKLNHKRSREWHNSKKQDNVDGGNGLLRRLGRLWLTSQVRELEKTEQADIPTLLAVDTTTLHEHLRRVKQLLRTRNFIFLIPSVVLQELDELKRERSTARDAIRWLEIQLKSGSRFLRTQRPGQSKPLSLLKCPRKVPQNIQNFVQILEFCNHFIADEKHTHGGNGDDNSLQSKSPFLILLVGNELGLGDDQYKEYSVTGAAKAAGISVEYVGDFYSKWRQAIQKTGKKR